MRRRLARAIHHVAFEDLGSFSVVLDDAGYDVVYADLAEHGIGDIDALEPDLLVVLDGPVGEYDHETYPVIGQEVWLLHQRLAADRPTLGICLGAQMMAAALGARVYPGPVSELATAGINPVTLRADATRHGAALEHTAAAMMRDCFGGLRHD